MKRIFNYIILLFIAFFTVTSVNASTNEFDRNELQNYGVNKKWTITDLNRQNVLNTKAVDAREKIYDYADVLTPIEENNLYAQIAKFINEYKTDMVIVTYSLPYVLDTENENFAADFYDYNDFGIDFENYSGILLFRNTYFEDPYYDMYTFGNAQLYFNSYRYNNILDEIYAYLHSGDYFNGFSIYIDMITNFYEVGKPLELENYKIDEFGYLYQEDAKGIKYYYDEYAHEYYYIDEEGNRKKYILPFPIKKYLFPTFLISGITTLIVISVMIKKNKMVIKAKIADEYVSNVNYDVSTDTLVSTNTTRTRIVSDSSGGGGGGHSSGGFSSHSGSSGGGHSSGGGRHG